MMTKLFKVLSTLILLVSASSEAKPVSQFLYGFEIELSNYPINKDSEAKGGEEVYEKTAIEHLKLFVERIKQVCPTCVTAPHAAKYRVPAVRVTIPHLGDYGFVVNLDPGLIELQMDPMTFAELKEMRSELQKIIYDVGSSIGIYPFYGAANHIHISVSQVFGHDVRFFRNFIVDYMNHPELASGVFEFDHNNAPPLAALPLKQREIFKKIISDFDQNQDQYTIKTLATRLQKEVYTAQPAGWKPFRKYQALGLNRIVDDRYNFEEWTIEVRAVRGPSNIDELELMTEFFERRLNFIKKVKTLIPVTLKPLAPNFTLRQATGRFRKLIKGMRLSWKKYEPLTMEWDPTVNPSESDRNYYKLHMKNSCRILAE